MVKKISTTTTSTIDIKKLTKKISKEVKKKLKASSKAKEKILKNPKAKLPSYSGNKIIQQMAREQGALIKEADLVNEKYKNPVQDNRSLFFREAFKSEKKKQFGGFI